MKIKTSEGKIIYIDPFAGTDYLDSADVVLITHQHSDHNQLGLVRRKATCTVITNNESIKSNVYQSFTIGNISVDAVAAYNSNHSKSACVGYVLEFDGIKLYHAGDTGVISEMADLASRGLTYALLPMDGIYTMTPEEATQAAGMIKAKYYIPMHTMPPPDTYNDAIVARFTVPNKIIVKNGESIELTSAATSVEEPAPRALMFILDQNYPNPFNPSTRIAFQLAMASYVHLKVFDMIGREVTTLVSEELQAGRHSRQWDATNMPSGVYFYRLSVVPLGRRDPAPFKADGQGGYHTDTRKLMLLR
jgi:L-ascorbate metabolism protein UlaG (beta-lactamase superfamily)